MKEKKVTSLKIVFEDGNDYSLACEVGLDKDELAKYIERAFKPEPAEPKLNGEVREIVRHWANLHGYDKLRVGFTERATQIIFRAESPDTRKCIEFSGAYVADDFDAGHYTIAELCGEEEE